MDFQPYVRKPFVVEAVEVTEENIGEIATYVGELRSKDDGTPFIFVDRRLVPNIFRVYPGFFMTRMGDHIRCYSRKVFFEQFTASTPEIQTWVDFMTAGAVENSRVAQA
jgi:hypothetical protein